MEVDSARLYRGLGYGRGGWFYYPMWIILIIGFGVVVFLTNLWLGFSGTWWIGVGWLFCVAYLGFAIFKSASLLFKGRYVIRAIDRCEGGLLLRTYAGRKLMLGAEEPLGVLELNSLGRAEREIYYRGCFSVEVMHKGNTKYFLPVPVQIRSTSWRLFLES